ncbi:MAG: hypothetical protein ACI814_002002 [Mariniblastus sp.]|jgi:hypothetical protein
MDWVKNLNAKMISFLVWAMIVGSGWALTEGAVCVEDQRNPTVGAAGLIEELVLPGSELIGKPLAGGDSIVVRVLRVAPHGDSFRYDIRFYGMEPGKFDLAKWMERKDGSTTDDLPEIDVEIVSLLPPGQIEPNGLETGWLPSLGGYRNVMVAAIVLWGLGLLGLIFMGRKKPPVEAAPGIKLTLADLLKVRIEAAMEDRMDSKQYAELERMLVAFWKKRLKLDSLAPHEALAKIKSNPESGPLINQIEAWMHSPNPDRNIELGGLLKPFRDLPADTPEFESASK